MADGTERWRTVVREVGLSLVTAGVVVLLFVAYELVGTNFTEQHNQRVLAKEFHHALSAGAGAHKATTTATTTTVTHPTSGDGTKKRSSTTTSVPVDGSSPRSKALTAALVAPPGGALDHIEIPAIGVNRYVVEGVSEADLQMGPGHYIGTPLPGQPGNVGIAGHRTTFGAPFFELNQLVAGDLIYFTDRAGNTWVYKAQRQWVVAPADVGVLQPTPGAELTLTTCNPRFEATSRLVVRASLFKHYVPGAKLPLPLPARVAGKRAISSTPVGTLPPAPAVASTTATTAPSRGAVPPGGDNPTVGPSTTQAAAPVLGSGGTGAWLGAVLWGALALVLWVLARALALKRHRWGKVLTVAGGGAICLVPLWFAFGNVVNLLPANI